MEAPGRYSIHEVIHWYSCPSWATGTLASFPGPLPGVWVWPGNEANVTHSNTRDSIDSNADIWY